MIETSPQHNDALFQTAADPGARLLPRSGGLPGLHNRLSSTDPATRQLRFAPAPVSRLPLLDPPASTEDNPDTQDSVAKQSAAEQDLQEKSGATRPDSPVQQLLHDAESASQRALSTAQQNGTMPKADSSPVDALRSLIESTRATVLTTEHPPVALLDDNTDPHSTDQRLVTSEQSSPKTAEPRQLKRGLNRLAPKTDAVSQKLRRKLERIREKKGLTSAASASAPGTSRKKKDYVGRVAPSVPLPLMSADSQAQPATNSETKQQKTAPPEPRSKTHSSDTKQTSVSTATQRSVSKKRRSKSSEHLDADRTRVDAGKSSRSAKTSSVHEVKAKSSRSSNKAESTAAKTHESQRRKDKRTAMTAAAMKVVQQDNAAPSTPLPSSRMNDAFTPTAVEPDKVRADVVPPTTANDSDIAGPMFIDLQQFTESRIDVTFLSSPQTDYRFATPAPVAPAVPEPTRAEPASASHPARSSGKTAQKLAEERAIEEHEAEEDELQQIEQHARDEEVHNDEASDAWFDFQNEQQAEKLRAREEARRLAERVGARTRSAEKASSKTRATKPRAEQVAATSLAFSVVDKTSKSKNRNELTGGQSQNRKRKTAAAAAALTLVEPAPAPVEPYSEWFKRVVLRNRGMMLFTTFYLHWLVLLLLAAIIVHAPENPAALLITATFSNDEPETSAFEVLTTEPEPITVDDPVPVPEPLTSERVAEMEERELDIDNSFLDNLHPDGVHSASDSAAKNSSDAASDSANTNNPHQYRDSSPVQAVREGSFSVWTDPPHPKPGESYRLIIQVKLPPNVKRYSITDLQGVVVGSDGYRKPIPGFMKGDLPIVDGYVRLAVPIVSADKKVCDTVFIRSKLLRETQKLMVEFL